MPPPAGFELETSASSVRKPLMKQYCAIAQKTVDLIFPTVKISKYHLGS
jgi:hypothetical protein